MDIFHRHREAQELELADAMLELALQTPEYRPEALIWKGIDALPIDPKLAFIYLSNAANDLPDRPDVHALLGRSMLAQGQPELATRYLSRVWQKHPYDSAVRIMLWHAHSQSTEPGKLCHLILQHLPEITAGNELALVLKLLAAQPDAIKTVGVIHFSPERKEVNGWAVDLCNIHKAPELLIQTNGRNTVVTANCMHPMLVAAGLPATHGGIRIEVPNAIPTVAVRFSTGQPLLGSPVAATSSFCPPGAKRVCNVDRDDVDVLIPVYDGIEETLECINSAIAASVHNRTSHRLVVLDDATPIVALKKELVALARKGKITLIRHPINMGFIRSINRGMLLNQERDVVWLNADTRVQGNWLDRLRTTAYLHKDIASVTPLTNNGELMSFPISRVSSAMPSPAEQLSLDHLAQNLGLSPVELVTGCGFCLYIKRAALDSVGYLDEIHLKRGYGEETDWCLRANAMGWRHMGATNLFVAHKGGISFGEEKLIRVAYNNAILKKRFVKAEAQYEEFCARDPIQPARNLLQRARLRAFERGSARNGIGGLTEIHVQPKSPHEYALSLTSRQSNLGPIATIHLVAQPFPIVIDYKLPTQFQELVLDLRLLGELADGSLNAVSHVDCSDHLIMAISEAGLTQREMRITNDNTHFPTNQSEPVTGHYLISDGLNRKETTKNWQSAVREIATSQNCLLLSDDELDYHGLRSTGKVYQFCVPAGLSKAESMILAGVKESLVRASFARDIPLSHPDNASK